MEVDREKLTYEVCSCLYVIIVILIIYSGKFCSI